MPSGGCLRSPAWTQDLVDLYLRHPWALRVSYARPVLGPHEQEVLESLIEVMRATELGPGLLRRVVGMLFHAVRGTALTIADAREAERRGFSEKDWWQSSSAALSHLVPDFADRFPNTKWLLSDSGDGFSTSAGGYIEQPAMVNLRAGLDCSWTGDAFRRMGHYVVSWLRSLFVIPMAITLCRWTPSVASP